MAAYTVVHFNLTHWSVDDNSFKCSALIEAVLLSLYVVGGSVLRREGQCPLLLYDFGQYELVNYLFSLHFYGGNSAD